MERRTIINPRMLPRVETRADGKKFIEGYAAVFYNANDPGSEYQIWDDFKERIMPGAFDRAIRDQHDARALFNHNPDLVLGRRSAGTTQLMVDSTGLKYSIDPPDTQLGRDLLVSLERRDVTGSSFSFSIYPTGRASWLQQDGVDIRQIEDLDLYDVGPVTFPAYESASSGLRCLRFHTDDERKELLQQRDAWLRLHHASGDEVAMRLRLLELDEA